MSRFTSYNQNKKHEKTHHLRSGMHLYDKL